MRKLRALWVRLRGMLRREKADDGFTAELESHLQMHIEDNLRSGMTPEQARRQALIKLGGLEQTKQAYRERSILPVLDSLLRDAHFALRQLRKNPGFTCTAVLVLALGIGASVAMFAFVDAALLQPLPYVNPARLMSVNESRNVESELWPLSYPDFVDWQQANKSFSSFAIYGGRGFLLRTSSGAEPVQGERVSGRFFQTLGIEPILGRDFHPDEDRLGGPNVVILSYGVWLHRFGARRGVVGQTVDLDNTAFTVIGVLPRLFSFAPSGNVEFWVPINALSTHEYSRTFYAFSGVGRLRDGITVQAAQADLTAIARRLQQQYGITGRNLSASVVPLSEFIIGGVQPILLTLLGGAGLLLLIACVNVASLVLARSESRRHEIALRGALGATQIRLVRQFFTEAVLLAGFGGVTGIAVAAGLVRLLARFISEGMALNTPFLKGAGLNVHTYAFAGAVILIAALLSTVTPILRLSFQKIRDGLAEGDRGAANRLWQRMGANLAVVELAVAVVLLAGAGLLGKSLYRLLHVPLGFDPNRLATVSVMAPGTVYKSDEQIAALYQEVVRRVSNLPGVESAGLTSLLPIVGCNCPVDRIHFPGRPYHDEENDVVEKHVGQDYLPTLKARLRRGRFFADSDDASRPGVAVVNEALARKYFPGQDPIGQRIADDEGGLPSEWEIVGVIDDVREGPLDADTWPAEYFPINQTRDHYFSLAVRTRQEPGALLPVLVSTLHQINPGLGISDEATMNEKIGETQAALLHRFSAWLVGGFAAMALILGVVGLYGVIAYSVSRRTREIGVRMALGAQRNSVYGLILRQAGWLTAIGLVIGLICSMGTSILIQKMLFDVHAWDMITLIEVAALLGFASLAASFLPARRAASVNPVEALRTE
ncbi:MAG TPA: ABC transporter permease [Alloacidobacterium sp.]|nr:ABC transporter permease [Alloacidobacterium sp.]